MNTDRIDYISSSCDRWCERCAYTMRCSAFATEAAMGMRGDFGEALRLAVESRSRSARGGPSLPGSSKSTRPSPRPHSGPNSSLIADVIGDELPLELAMQLEGLAKEVESECPQARAFERPGFDEPDR